MVPSTTVHVGEGLVEEKAYGVVGGHSKCI